MAESLKETHQTNPKNNCFLGCFGFSMKNKKPIKKKTRLLSSTDKAEFNHSKTKTSKPYSKPHKPSRQNSKADHQLTSSTDQVTRETPKEKRLPLGNRQIYAPVNSKKLLQKNQVVEKFDPIIMGMSIITVTLVIMLLWGRVCSILCTSAWLYVCPRLRTRINSNESTVQSTVNSNDIHLNSKDYKKKVVLEGLLERNHRITS